MPRTIMVKGVGEAAAKPDYVVLSMTLESRNISYEMAMSKAVDSIDQLNEALETVGFDKKSVKTTNFNVNTEYENEQNADGRYKSVFKGYVVSHSLKVEFDFDNKRLTAALSAVGGCIAHPELSIAFTVKDQSAIEAEMLQSATENAARKAEILCRAAGVGLGELVSIEHAWGELNIRSQTSYSMADNCLASPLRARAVEIEPDDVKVSDSATFVWEIK